MEYSNTRTSKRARMPGSGSQVPSCLVDGCCSDLSKCRDYHRRHKVCEPHSKASKVFIRGAEQRFCQQCSRFHSLVEFDEGKRSCRKRLEGHNRRRRKPQPDSLFANSPRLFSDNQGTRYIHFGDSPEYSSSTATMAALAGLAKEEDGSSIILNYHSALNFSDRKSQFPGSTSNSCRDVKQLPFLQGTTPLFPSHSVSQANLEATTILGDGGIGLKIFSEGLTVDSNRALSLLSSPPPTASREINASHMVETCPNPVSHSLISSLNYGGVGVESQPLGSVLVPNIRSSNANIHVHNMVHLLPDGSSSNGAQQKVSFTWK